MKVLNTKLKRLLSYFAHHKIIVFLILSWLWLLPFEAIAWFIVVNLISISQYIWLKVLILCLALLAQYKHVTVFYSLKFRISQYYKAFYIMETYGYKQHIIDQFLFQKTWCSYMSAKLLQARFELSA